ncbi:DNA-binding WRKY [Corchorus olitorius]|uniref:DNA-binding WRKY n=1 Tax=Corchorus olitorius TaxID=93759 RepID=A0A1R3J5A1_9ROSI|nr:DNA-binding WRKY [Corchorus olitorius]
MGTTLSPCSEKLLTSNKKSLIEGLVHGQEYATQLQILFHKSVPKEEDGRRRLSAEELVQKILRSFNETISALSSSDSADVVSQNQATNYSTDDISPCCDDRRSEDSSESRKKLPGSKDKRGCYKRKRSAQTWVAVSSTTDDGHAWRKYGQKEILNSKHPRSYFRCTRKYDQGCKATKQVQRMEDDSQKFQTTYIGTHTCKNSFKAPKIFTTDSDQSLEEPNYNVNHSGESKNIVIIPTVKQEAKEETTTPTSDLTDSTMIMWKDIMAESGMSDYGDVVSSVYSCNEITSGCRSFEMDFGIKAVGVDQFDGDFQFDDI